MQASPGCPPALRRPAACLLLCGSQPPAVPPVARPAPGPHTAPPRPAAVPPSPQLRKRLAERVAAGDIDAALQLTRQLAPGLLEANPRIHFRLQCQKFAEMVRPGRAYAAGAGGGAAGGGSGLLHVRAPPTPALSCPSTTTQIKVRQVAEAIEFGRAHVVPLAAASGGGSSGAADRELLEDATALLAYDDPATGPTGARSGRGRQGRGGQPLRQRQPAICSRAVTPTWRAATRRPCRCPPAARRLPAAALAPQRAGGRGEPRDTGAQRAQRGLGAGGGGAPGHRGARGGHGREGWSGEARPPIFGRLQPLSLACSACKPCSPMPPCYPGADAERAPGSAAARGAGAPAAAARAAAAGGQLALAGLLTMCPPMHACTAETSGQSQRRMEAAIGRRHSATCTCRDSAAGGRSQVGGKLLPAAAAVAA